MSAFQDLPSAYIAQAGDVVQIAAGQRFHVEDVAKVAFAKFAVDIDAALLEKLDQDMSKKIAHGVKYVASPEDDQQGECFHASICRAAIFMRIITIAQGRAGIRAAVLHRLVDMLNADVVPYFTSSERAGQQLAHILVG